MRTTVTLDPDTEQLVRRRMRERNQTFKQALNDAIRAGSVAGADTEPFQTQTASMGVPQVDLDRALQVVAGLGDHELIREQGAGT